MIGQAVSKALGTILIVGARSFIFSSQVRSSSRVRWWGAMEDGKDILPDNLCLAFVKRGLARTSKVRTLVLPRKVELVEFSEESELFIPLAKVLGIEPNRGKEVVEAPKPTPSNDYDVLPVVAAEDLALSEERVISVPVSRIRRFENQPRRYFNKERLLALGRSMLKAGQKIPIILIPVEKDPEHDYQLYDGERRWRAAKLVGKVALRAIIAQTMDEASLFKGSAICNMGREGHESMDVALALKRIRENERLTYQELADSFACSVSWVTQHLGILKLDPKVQEMLNPELPEEQRITFSAAQEVVKLPLEHQLAAAQHILEHSLNLARVRHYIRKLTAEVGVSSDRRKRKPSDEHKVLRSFLTHTLMRVDQFLDLPGGITVGSLFRNRSYVDADKSIQTLETLIQRLRKIQCSIKEEAKR